MRSQGFAATVLDRDPFRLAARLPDLLDNRRPHQPASRLRRLARLTPHAQHGADRAFGPTYVVASDQDHRRRTVSGDEGSRRVNHVRQVHVLVEPLDELLAELALICPTNPAARSEPLARTASWNSRSANGTDSAYLPEQDLYRSR